MSSEDTNIVEKKTPLWLLSLVVTLPTFFAFLATSATIVALPHIAGSFGSTNDEAKWVVTSYMIANGVFLPLTGWLERTLGRHNFFKIFVSLFTIGSIFCTFATSLPLLIIGRIIQGVGGGILMPFTQSILIQDFPKDRKGDAMAIFIFAVMISSIMGPTVGGLIVDNLSWQWIFIINIPVGIISLIVFPFVVSDTQRQRKKETIDFIGLTFLILWLFSMQMVLDKGQQYGWFDCTWLCWLSGFSLFCLLFFIIWELENPTPIVNLRVFKNRNFLLGTFIGSSINVLACVIVILLPQFLQGVMGYTAAMTGLTMSSRVAASIGLLFIGKLCRIYDLRALITTGFIIIGISIGLCANINLGIVPMTFIFSNILFGIGIVCAVVPISAVALGSLEKNEISNAAGIHSLSKCVAGSISTSLASSFVIRLSQINQNYLVKDTSIYNPNFAYRINAIKVFFMHHSPLVVASKQANALVFKQLLVQSKLCAFVDLFQFFALTTFLLIPLIFLLKINNDKKSRS